MYPRDDVSIVALKFVISVDEKIIFPVVLKYYIPCSILDSLRALPPMDFCTVILHEIILQKVQFLRGRFLTKKLSVPGGNFSNYFMKILVLSQLYRSKSATLEIAYDMKIDS